jgi:hypothetical protein
MSKFLTKKDWGEIHARAFKDPKFRHKLETDPTGAVREYAAECGLTIDRIVDLTDWLKQDVDQDYSPPPACC